MDPLFYKEWFQGFFEGIEQNECRLIITFE